MKSEETKPVKKIELIVDDPSRLDWHCTNVTRLELMGILWQGLQSLQSSIAPAIIKENALEPEKQ